MCIRDSVTTRQQVLCIHATPLIASLKKLREAIRRRRPEGNLHAIILHHDNARPRQVCSHKAMACTNGVPYPPYSPDLTAWDFYLFWALKYAVRDDSESVIQKRWKIPLERGSEGAPQTVCKVFSRRVTQVYWVQSILFPGAYLWGEGTGPPDGRKVYEFS